MGKYYGTIGFAKTEETSPGIWEQQIITKQYYGDVIKRNVMWQSNNNVNDDLNISSSISIIADKFAYDNLTVIRYAELNNVKWKITNIDIQHPRIILTLGGVYNGEA